MGDAFTRPDDFDGCATSPQEDIRVRILYQEHKSKMEAIRGPVSRYLYAVRDFVAEKDEARIQRAYWRARRRHRTLADREPRLSAHDSDSEGDLINLGPDILRALRKQDRAVWARFLKAINPIRTVYGELKSFSPFAGKEVILR